MNEFTLEEINFLRWLLSTKFTSVLAGERIQSIFGDAKLTEHQSDLLFSIQRKLVGLSSY